jgi:glycosyltransferase involved in cell wall biosynthesis
VDAKDERRNVLYLSPSNRWLGARISLYILLKMLDKERFHPIVICPPDGGVFGQRLESEGFDVKYVRLWNWRKYRYVLHRWQSVGKIVGLLRRCDIHLIHCNEFWTAPYAFWATRFVKVPAVSHVRLFMTPEKIRQYYLGHMARIICVCKALVEEFSAWPDYKKRVVAIYNGIDLKEFDPGRGSGEEIRAKYNISESAVVIGLVGQISPRKGQHRLISIAPALVRRYPNVRFLIVGSSREAVYQAEIRRMIAECNLQEHFIFTGDEREMPKIYKALDILVLPTLQEGFGRVVVEAEAMEIPVVVSNAGGLAEVVDPGKTGFIYTLGKDEEMLDYLMRLSGDSQLRRRLGVAGREFVAEHFSQERMIEHVTALYLEVMRDASRSR